tara:strand:+ start:128 stop:526 length:399 start_codon:yes stop_codon:yes gene_type:complete
MTIFQDQNTLLTILPISIYITLYFNNKSKSDMGTFLNKYEKFLTKPIIITLIALITNIIGDHVKPKAPKYINNIFKKQNKIDKLIPRYIGLIFVIFLLTRDIEMSIVTTITFLLILQLLRTEEEKKEYPYLI